MFMKNFLSANICLTIVTIWKIQVFWWDQWKSSWQNERRVWRKCSWWICWIKVKDVLNKNIDGKEFNTAKGVNIATESKKFKDTLFNRKIIRHKMKRFQSKKQRLGTCEINKISFSSFDDKRSSFDDKRFVLDSGIHTLAYFHRDINSYR